MKDIKAIIFDKDGTLFDTEHFYEEAWYSVANQMGFTFTNDIAKAIRGRSGQTQVEVIQTCCPTIDAYMFQERFTLEAETNMRKHLKLKPGVREILEHLKQKGYPMGIASGGPRWLIEENLKQAHIDHYFISISSGLEVKHSKPSPDVFYDACQRMHVAPEHALVFEDSENGVKAALAAGCQVIMIPEQEPIEGVTVYNDFYDVLRHCNL